jgi:tetratricopeptide (TPR) repeat protein
MVHVTLRLHKVGGQEKLIEITKRPGTELEGAVLTALQPVLAPSAETTDQLGLSEGKLHNSRGMESAANNDRFSRFHNIAPNEPASSSPQRTRDFQSNRRATIESFEKAMLLDPKNVQAKFMLGYALLGDQDPAQRERAKELLKEVVALKDPSFSQRAAFNLEHADRFVQNQVAPPDQRTAPTALPEHIRAKMDMEAFEKPYRLNPTNVQAEYNYGFALFRSSNTGEHERGVVLLKQVAAANDATYSKLAAAHVVP